MRSKLSFLTEKFLKRLIQAGSHDSIQDARAAMDLVLLKIKCACPAVAVFLLLRVSRSWLSMLAAWEVHAKPVEACLVLCRNGPAFGVQQAREPTGDRLLQVLAASGVRCSMIDRRDALNRHVTGG